MEANATPKTIEWVGGLDGHVLLIDQTLLPERLEILMCRDLNDIWEAIKHLKVRGAPAIGIAAAMGVVLGIRQCPEDQRSRFFQLLTQVCDRLIQCRPTAVNLTWALNRMRTRADWTSGTVAMLKQAMLAEAKAIRDEDAAMCRAIGAAGEHLIRENGRVLTHCNAGGLATAEYGTALAIMYTAHEKGRKFQVFADETRPLLQGSRLTAWELNRAGIDTTVICDNMAGSLMKDGKVDLVVTGADRIVANGDVANKIGTYSLAVLANAHGVPFYVAAPSSTFDLNITHGEAIPIESRGENEVRKGFGVLTAPADVKCHTAAFDVTPAQLIAGLITERGIIQPVNAENITRMIKTQEKAL